MREYKRQIEKGAIKEAYTGLMDYFGRLRLYFENNHPEYPVSSNIYYGFMDMTYFALFPEPLKNKKMKIAIVFLHDKFRFEVWLAGINKAVQNKYWQLFKDSNWKKYNVPPTTKGVDSIIEHILVDNPDFGDLDFITRQIEKGVLEFTKDIERFIFEHKTEDLQPQKIQGNQTSS